MPKSTATSFALSRIQTFLAKTGRVSLPSSAKPGSQPQKNNCTRTRARTTTRISNRISRSPSPTTPKSLQYATSLKLIVPAIAASTSPLTNATHATLVATIIAILNRAKHHRDPISGVTIIELLAVTALPSAEPNSKTRNISNSNSSRSPSNFLLTINRLWSTRPQLQKNVSIRSEPTKRPLLLRNPGSTTPLAQKQ